MDFLNSLLVLPGEALAVILHDFFSVFAFLYSAFLIYLLAQYFIQKRKDYLCSVIILFSILLAFLPSWFNFASTDSKLFWLCILGSAILGFAYYFIDKEHNLNESITGLSSNAEVQKRFNGYVIFLALLLVFSFYLRIFKIEQYPAGYYFLELDAPGRVIEYDSGRLNFHDYLHLFTNPHPPGFTYYSTYSPIVIGLAIPFYKLFGISLVTGRYFYMIWGMAGLLFLFLYLREHFPPRSTIFLVSFTSLGLVNVAFSRIGTFHITSFTYTVFLLYLLEVTFKPRKSSYSALLAFLFGLATFGAMYLYHPTKVAIVIVLMILAYKIFLRKGFLVQNWVPLSIFSLTFFLTIQVYSGGNILGEVPSGAGLGYIKSDPGTSIQNFMKDAIDLVKKNMKIVVDRVAFLDRAPDSLSRYNVGGLIPGPVLCFIPFAVGFSLAGVRRERFFILWIVILLALLPPLLVDVPNASRMLLFLSLLLILPGITFYLLSSKIQRIFEPKRFQYLIPAGFLFLLFSYNLYIYFDINSHMIKSHSVRIPFAESGFGDKTYSKFATTIASEVNEYTKNHNVYLYFSDIFDENVTAPSGTYEQLFIASYENIKRGATLVWMNRFHQGLHGQYLPWNKIYFYGFEPAFKMMLGSDRDVKVFFIKPLADEIGVYEGLKAFFPKSVTEEHAGEVDEDKYLILTIKKAEIDDLKRRLGNISGPTIVELYRESRSRELRKKINVNSSFDGYFFLEKDSKILFKNNPSSDLDIIVDNVRLTDKDRDLSFLKGAHSIRVRPVKDEPFVAIDAETKAAYQFSEPLISQLESMELRRSNSMKLYSKKWFSVKSESYLGNYPTLAFHYLKNGEFVYSSWGPLLNGSNQSLLPYEGAISRVFFKNTELIVLYFSNIDHSRAIIYDSAYHKLKEFQLEGYPFDIFSGETGEIYITYLDKKKITIIKPDYSQETWDTSSFADYPIWNGDVDGNGDIILLSGNGDLFVFDKNRNLYANFKVDASWAVNMTMLRYGGGLIVSNGIMHVLDSQNNAIKSYDKAGHRLCISEKDCSLFDVPPDFKIDFMQKFSDGFILLDSAVKRQILTFQAGN